MTSVITGASSGLGLAIARFCLERGEAVVGLSRSRPALDHPGFTYQPCDLGDQQQVVEVGARLAAEHRDLDLLVHAAGLGRFAPLEELPVADIGRQVATNLLGPILLTRQLLRRLRDNRATVMLLSSVESRRASRTATAYAASKAGLSQFGRCLAEENRRQGLKVVELVLGMVRTPFYDELGFEPHPDGDAALETAQVLEALEFALNSATPELWLEAPRPRIERKT